VTARDLLRRWWPPVAVAGLLAAAALAAGHSRLGASRVPPASDAIPYVPDYPTVSAPPSIPVEPRRTGPATGAHVPGWVGTVAVVVLGLLVAVVVGYLLWRLLRGVGRRVTVAVPPTGPARRSADGTAREVVAALDAGLVDLDDTTTDPRTAVIACWVRLEQAAAAAGVPRRAGDTAADLVTRLLRGDPAAGVPAIVSADVLAGFARVYREARYATHPVDAHTRDQAREALRRLRGELTATEPGTVPG
jgi:hypothetical protein